MTSTQSFETSRSRRARDHAKRGLRKAFELGQRVGVDVLPRHFYSAIPDVRALRATTGWRSARSMVGVAGLDVKAQLDELENWFTGEVRDALESHDVYLAAVEANGAAGYGPAEASVLYAFVASQRPRRVVQIGAGVSTAVVLDAAERHGFNVDITCIDPYPTELLERLAASGRITLVRERAQDVELEVMTSLDSGDLLFVDSTHTVKPDSEVNRIVLEVLPRLSTGVMVHFHDIWFPFDYPRDLLEETLFFWNESTLLHAFLLDNARFEVSVSCSFLHYRAKEPLTRLIPGYRAEPDQDGLRQPGAEPGHFPASTYLRVVQGR